MITIQVDIDELLELINMHGSTLVLDCRCEDCGAPVKQTMLLRLERMRELILAVPDHLRAEDLHNTETMQ